jgi:chromosome segregation ATPase
MNSNLKIAAYSILAILTMLAFISAFWLGAENRRVYSDYMEEQALWRQKNRDLEFELDKFKIEIAEIRSKLSGYREQVAKLEDRKVIAEEELQSLASENTRLKNEVTRLVRDKGSLQERLQKSTKRDERREDEFWSNLLREKSALELQMSNLERLLQRKDQEISRFEDEGRRLNQITGELLEEKSLLEDRLGETKSLVSSFSQSLEQEREERFESIKTLEKLEQDKQFLALQLEQAQQDKLAAEKRLDNLKGKMAQEQEMKSRFEKRVGYVNQILEDKMLEVTRLKQDLETALEDIKNMAYDQEDSRVELPPIEIRDSSIRAKVISVNNSEGFIVIDRGRRDGVESGMESFIYREGRLIAKLRVKEVREVTSALDVLLNTPNDSIVKNDIVEFSSN